MREQKHYVWLIFMSLFITINGYANDICSNATQIMLGVCEDGNNVTATPDLQNSCNYNKASVWYWFLAPQTGDYSIKINNSTFNDVLSVYSDCSGTTEIACTNRDEFGFEGEQLYLNNLAGGNYYIMVSGADCTFGRKLGYFCIEVSQGVTNPNAAPSNEECNGANEINLNASTCSITGSNLHASIANPQPSCSSYAGASVWYQITNVSNDPSDPASPNNLIISTAPNFSDVVALYSGVCGDMYEVACKKNKADNTDPMIVNLMGHNPPYYLQVTGSFATIEADFSDALCSKNDFYIEISTGITCADYDGIPCNDNNSATINDLWDNCECKGTCNDINTICDDGNPATTGDEWDTNCNCAGTCYNAGTECDDDNPATNNDQWDGNCNCVGVCDQNFNNCAPGETFNVSNCECEIICSPGVGCDDGDIYTVNDTWDAFCNCVGECIPLLDLDPDDGIPPSCPNEEYEINEFCQCECIKLGIPCDDNEANTVDDKWNNDCECEGTCLYATPCNDNDPLTINDQWNENCICAGIVCPPQGTPCNDGYPNTVNDVQDGFCNCIGEGANGEYDVQLVQTQSTDCQNSILYVDIQIRATNPNRIFNVTNQNYYFDYSATVLGNPRKEQELDITGCSPPVYCFGVHYMAYQSGANLGTINYGVEHLSAGGGGFPVNTSWISVGRVAFDIIDGGACFDLSLHNYNSTPPTLIKEEYGGNTSIVVEGNMYLNLNECIDCCAANRTIVQADVSGEYQTSDYINTDETGAGVIIDNGENLMLKATNRVRLNTGLSVKAGASFKADTEDCGN